MLLVWGGDMKQTLSWVWVRAASADVLRGYEKTVTAEDNKKHYNFYNWIIWDLYFRSICHQQLLKLLPHLCLKSRCPSQHLWNCTFLIWCHFRGTWGGFSFLIFLSHQSITHPGRCWRWTQTPGSPSGSSLTGESAPCSASAWTKKKTKEREIWLFIDLFITPGEAKIWTFFYWGVKETRPRNYRCT